MQTLAIALACCALMSPLTLVVDDPADVETINASLHLAGVLPDSDVTAAKCWIIDVGLPPGPQVTCWFTAEQDPDPVRLEGEDAAQLAAVLDRAGVPRIIEDSIVESSYTTGAVACDAETCSIVLPDDESSN